MILILWHVNGQKYGNCFRMIEKQQNQQELLNFKSKIKSWIPDNCTFISLFNLFLSSNRIVDINQPLVFAILLLMSFVLYVLMHFNLSSENKNLIIIMIVIIIIIVIIIVIIIIIIIIIMVITVTITIHDKYYRSIKTYRQKHMSKLLKTLNNHLVVKVVFPIFATIKRHLFTRTLRQTY